MAMVQRITEVQEWTIRSGKMRLIAKRPEQEIQWEVMFDEAGFSISLLLTTDLARDLGSLLSRFADEMEEGS